MLTDSHCHLDKVDLEPFQNNFANMIDAATENDVSQFLCVCIDTEHFQDVLAPAQQYSNIHCSVGVHPTHKESYSPTVEELVELAKHQEVVAIGETGLDYFHYEDDDMSWQHDMFRNHIRAAIITQKPLIIHTRSAKEDTIRILQEENAQKVGGVMHCFRRRLGNSTKSHGFKFLHFILRNCVF